MKFGEQWLREWVNPGVSTEALADQLTMLGMEVEEVVPVASRLDDVVVGRVEAVEKHPNADKLSVCAVKKDDGNPVAVVTGAPGVKAGNCYPYAGVGAVLPGQAGIEEIKIRGVKSSGMLCSGAELDLSDEAGELFLLPDDAKPGARLTELMLLDDQVFDVGLTPNRGDCLSIKGIAREIAVANQIRFRPPGMEPVAAAHGQSRAINLVAADGCPRYVGRIINNIDISRSSPLWLREKLRRCGLRSLNVVVDVTNYVMLELGQPMHAFDNDKLVGAVSVRYAGEGEKITLLDNETRVMSTSTLVIADESGAVAMAGVMGGLDSAVTAQTRHIFLESAFFTPIALAGRPGRFSLNTDASHRFERGVDFELQRQAMERATRLLLEICGGEPGPVTEAVVDKALPEKQTVGLRPPAVEGLLGKPIDMDECKEILTRLGLKEEAQGKEGSRRFSVPTHRFDITIEEDLIEEIARVHGYQNIKSALPPVSLNMRKPGARIRLDALRRVLVNRGYQEAITYSFVSDSLQSLLFPESDSISLLNAISTDMERMRVSLWPGLLTALQRNINRQQQRVRLFETGKVFTRTGKDKIRQAPAIGGLIFGKVMPEQWDNPRDSSDFYDMKSDVEAVLSACSGQIQLNYRPIAIAALHDGKSAEIIYDDKRIGLIGALHPGLQSRLGIDLEVCLFEIYLAGIPAKLPPKFTKISKFPIMRRDLSILVNEEIPIENLLKNVRITSSKLLTNLELFDVYQGESIDPGEKSVTLGLTFQQTSSTLTDEEVEGTMNLVLDSLRKEFEARLRE